MSIKYLIVGSLFGAITLFLWGAVAHMLFPWENNIIREFADKEAFLEELKKSAPQNGIYVDSHGVFAAVSFRPDFGDKFQSMGRNLAIEFAANIAVAFLLCLVVAGLRTTSLGARAFLAGLAGLASGFDILGSFCNWYGFSEAFGLAEIAIVTVGWFLAGLVIASLQKKMVPGLTS